MGYEHISRAPTDAVRFAVRQAAESVGGHELLVYVNDVEMTRAGAGMGMDPFAVLIPDNRLVATSDPTQVPIARCECGTYGCGSTDVTIVRDGAAVHWEWHYEVPIDHGVTFPADQYDAEVERIAADHTWERPEDTTARLVLTGIDREPLAEHGLTVTWAGKDHADAKLFKVALFTGDVDYRSAAAAYQVFLRFPRTGRSSEDVAAAVIDELATAPASGTPPGMRSRLGSTSHLPSPADVGATSASVRRALFAAPDRLGWAHGQDSSCSACHDRRP